jgi:hypothetical protein
MTQRDIKIMKQRSIIAYPENNTQIYCTKRGGMRVGAIIKYDKSENLGPELIIKVQERARKCGIAHLIGQAGKEISYSEISFIDNFLVPNIKSEKYIAEGERGFGKCKSKLEEAGLWHY